MKVNRTEDCADHFRRRVKPGPNIETATSKRHGVGRTDLRLDKELGFRRHVECCGDFGDDLLPIADKELSRTASSHVRSVRFAEIQAGCHEPCERAEDRNDLGTREQDHEGKDAPRADGCEACRPYDQCRHQALGHDHQLGQPDGPDLHGLGAPVVSEEAKEQGGLLDHVDVVKRFAAPVFRRQFPDESTEEAEADHPLTDRDAMTHRSGPRGRGRDVKATGEPD